MSRSNPAALHGVIGSCVSNLEMPTEATVDRYLQTTTAHYRAPPDHPDSQTPTPTAPDSYDRGRLAGMVQGWSEATLTEAQSIYSWSTDEGEFDRAATKRVGRMFDRVNGALYEGRGSGYQQTDRECREWAETFPHFEVQGEHLLDSLDDGTEVVECLHSTSQYSSTYEQEEVISSTESLVVVGKRIEPASLSDSPEDEALREEVIAVDGVVEEYFAFDNSAESGDGVRRRRYRTVASLSHRLPPVTPEACVRHVVFSQVMDLLWSEVVSLLQPLVIAARDRALKEHSSRQSLLGSLSTSHGSSPHESHLLPGLSSQLPAGSQHNSQYYHGKPSTSSLATPALPQLPRPPALSGVMQIKPVSLRQRIPVMSLMPHDEREEDILSHLSIHHGHQQTAESASLTQSRLARHNFSLLQRTSDYHLPSGLPSPPGAQRLISGRLPSRRHQLRPIDNPRTPALGRIEDTRIRGFKLSTTAGQTSPPPTAGGGGVRNIQLPPLELGGRVSTAGMSSTALATGLAERSPPVVRGKSTFFQRSSAASALSELQELRRSQFNPRPSGQDLRPNTSSTTFRAESGKHLGKKLTDHRGGMKIVGHATGVGHSGSGAGGVEQIGGRGGSFTVGSIAEGEEEEEEGEGETIGLNITGRSGFLQSKPRSLSDNRGKHRGHVR